MLSINSSVLTRIDLLKGFGQFLTWKWCIAMKVYLDDLRPAPKGWIRCYWPDEVIELLKKGLVAELSLDHDLGDDKRGTGYDVILWIERAIALHQFRPPLILIHSANPAAALRMARGIDSINNLLAGKTCHGADIISVEKYSLTEEK